MSTLKGACLIGQSGGPTSVINASTYGAIKAALADENITAVYGAAHGIKGVLNEELLDMSQEDPAELALLPYTPSSFLGSVRYKIADPADDDTDYKRILEVFQKYNIRYFFYNGGNDSMDTCNKISKYMQSAGYECRIAGIPKTIDNDLAITDHCPGYGSAAKYIATTIMEVHLDATVYDKGQITIIEIMGRNAGWLAAAASLASIKGLGPDLVYLPEAPFSMDKFLTQIETIYKEKNNVIVAVSEGIKDANGTYISEYSSDLASNTDAFGHKQMGGLAATLANIVKTRTGAKVRGIELSLLQRCGSHLASATDINEAQLAGEETLHRAVKGESDFMLGFKRISDKPYEIELISIPLSEVANFEKKVPLEWIKPDGLGMSEEFYAYALPLINGETAQPKEDGLPRFARIKKVFVK